MPENATDLDAVERELPAAAEVAFARAQIHVLASGMSVLQSRDGAIYEVFPDGRTRFVKEIEPPTQVIVGRKVTLK